VSKSSLNFALLSSSKIISNHCNNDNHRTKTNKKDVEAERIYYQDAAVVRYRNKQDGVMIHTDTTFFNLFNKYRPNNPFWKEVELIQTCIKSKWGNGEQFKIQYYAPIDEIKPQAEVCYTYKSKPIDQYLLMSGNYQDYCLK
jgi:hypothetical protein